MAGASERQGKWYRDWTRVSGSHYRACCVCELGDALKVTWAPKWSRADDEESYICGHNACESCLRTWVVAQLSMGRVVILCPETGCSQVIPSCTQRILAGQLWHDVHDAFHDKPTWAEITGGGTISDLKELEIQACPGCGAMIHRSAGCSTMRCISCGTAFDWDERDVMGDNFSDASDYYDSTTNSYPESD